MATEGTSISEASIGEKLKTSSVLQAQHVEIHDVSGGCGQSFEVIIVSGAFKGKPLLQRHRMVNSCLEEELKQIHAFSQKTYTPEQWEAQSNKS